MFHYQRFKIFSLQDIQMQFLHYLFINLQFNDIIIKYLINTLGKNNIISFKQKEIYTIFKQKDFKNLHYILILKKLKYLDIQ